MALRNRPPQENKQYNTNSEPNDTNQNPKWFADTLGIPKNACVDSARDFRHFRTRHETTPRKAPTNLDLGRRKFDVKQIFPDTARQPKVPAHIKEQTDGRISQTIFRIQSNQAKREMFPGFSVRHLDRFDAPGLEKHCLDGRHIRLYKPVAIRGRSRAASGPRQGRNFRASSAEKAVPAKML